MSIDRIGKGSGATPAAGIGQPGSSSEVSKSGAEFKVPKSDASEPVAQTPLDRLRAGEISVSQYLDIKVSEATSHLGRRLGTEQLEFIRNSLRQQLASDPMLVELVKSTTGSLPPQNE
jgi:hypothetical protein